MRRSAPFLIAALLLAGPSAAQAQSNDRLPLLFALIGTWHCSFQSGPAHQSYHAAIASVMNGNWVHEYDEWKSGASDESFFTYDPNSRLWTAVAMENHRTTTVFRGQGDGLQIVFHSVFPRQGDTEVFHRASATTYEVQFKGTVEGQPIVKRAVCTKQSSSS